MFAAYPMVEEADAVGRVAAVYAEMLDGMPMVPSLFKSLALCPPYLVMAWRQVASVQGTDELSRAVQRLVDAATERGLPPPSDADARQLLSGFVGPLGRMTVAAAGLRSALDGELGGHPASAQIAPRDQPPEPELDVPAQHQVGDTTTFDRIRAALGTPIVNSLWRHAAGRGVLARAWEDLEPSAAGARAASAELRTLARASAAELPWEVVASPSALDGAGCADAAPGMAAVLDAYLATLPAVLTLVAATAEG